MKICIEIPVCGEQPSQGRNRGSIPLGSASGESGEESPPRINGFVTAHLLPGDRFLTQLDGVESPFERVVFVGYAVAQPGLVVEDAHGDLHKIVSVEIDVSGRLIL